jgi:uncharacterized membrane protein
MATTPHERVPPHVAEAVETIARLHARFEREVSASQRSVETITSWLGRPSVVWGIAGIIAAWVGVNVAVSATGGKAFDPPPFPALQTVCSVGALVMGTVVLTAQNRQRRSAEDHARLDLQINLLAEQKVAKLISLVEELRRDMPDVVDRVDSLADAMTEAVDPHAVAKALRETVDVPISVPEESPSSPRGTSEYAGGGCRNRNDTGKA